MMFIKIILGLAIARILITFNLPDVKPFNCLPCLTAWCSLGVLLLLSPYDWYYFPIGYLTAQILMNYESK